MQIINNIAYADDFKNNIRVCLAKPLLDWHMLIRFNNGKEKIYDFKPILNHEVFTPLKNKKIFNNFTLEYGTITWCEGSIDIAPEELYINGKNIEHADNTFVVPKAVSF